MDLYIPRHLLSMRLNDSRLNIWGDALLTRGQYNNLKTQMLTNVTCFYVYQPKQYNIVCL